MNMMRDTDKDWTKIAETDPQALSNKVQSQKLKHTWMMPKCRDAKALEIDIGELLSNFGSKYTFSF